MLMHVQPPLAVGVGYIWVNNHTCDLLCAGYKLELELLLEFASKLVFKLAYKVVNAKLLAVEVEDAYYMR